MPRPKKDRSVLEPPLFTEFKPIGVPSNLLKQSSLSLDEYEAFRLTDYVGLSHEEASELMNISRSTFTRLIEKSRRKIAGLLVDGNILTIEGGNVHFRKNIIRCNSCGHMFNIDIQTAVTNCPECDSDRLQNMAGNFGHGRCCRRNK